MGGKSLWSAFTGKQGWKAEMQGEELTTILPSVSCLRMLSLHSTLYAPLPANARTFQYSQGPWFSPTHDANSHCPPTYPKQLAALASHFTDQETVRALSSCQDCRWSFGAKHSLHFFQLLKPQKSYWPPQTVWPTPFPPLHPPLQASALSRYKNLPKGHFVRQENGIYTGKARVKAPYSHKTYGNTFLSPIAKLDQVWNIIPLQALDLPYFRKISLFFFYEVVKVEFLYLSSLRCFFFSFILLEAFTGLPKIDTPYPFSAVIRETFKHLITLWPFSDCPLI